MTITYDPHDDAYLDEADVRLELARVFDVCNGCRQCIDLCGAFPTLFDIVGGRGGGEAGRMTPVQQDHVVDQCFQCTLCRLDCPYSPGRDDAAVDVPRLMRRALAMRRSTGQIGVRERASAVVITSAVLTGRTRPAAVVDATLGAPPGTILRRMLQRVSGLSGRRLVAHHARQRFSVWFGLRPIVRMPDAGRRVALYPTCTVEHHDPAIGSDLVHVLERNGVECTLAGDIGCCGAPWLDSGDVQRFTRNAQRVVASLAASVRSGHDVVVPQPACGEVLRHEYPVHVPGDDANIVAAHTFDASEYLMRMHRGAGSDQPTALDTDFTGDVPGVVTLHSPCRLRSQGADSAARELLEVIGARVETVHGCGGRCGVWGLRAEHADAVTSMASQLVEHVGPAGDTVVAGSCHHANTAIAEQSGVAPIHPVQVLARAYGLAPGRSS